MGNLTKNKLLKKDELSVFSYFALDDNNKIASYFDQQAFEIEMKTRKKKESFMTFFFEGFMICHVIRKLREIFMIEVYYFLK